MERPSAPSFVVFAVMSLSTHAAVLVAAGRANVVPAPPFEPQSQPLTGDTLDVQPESEAATADDLPAATVTTAERRAPVPAAKSLRDGRGHDSASSSKAVAPPPLTFGAVGVRSATDLATTFTRALPQAASADDLWSSAPLGNAGVAQVTLVIDDDGRLTDHDVRGAGSWALRRGIDRTLVLLAARSFTARAATTKLRVMARVSRDEVHDGLHGDVFALSGGSFSGEVGTAFFTLPVGVGPGRRVDLEVRLSPP